MSRLFVQLLRMLRTPEDEIGHLLTSSATGRQPPPELVRKLCQLQLDVIADVTQVNDGQLLTDWRSKIVRLWRKYMDDVEVNENEEGGAEVQEGNIKPLIDLVGEPSKVTKSSSSSTSKMSSPPPTSEPDSNYTSLNTIYSLFRKLATPEWLVDNLLDDNGKHSPVLMAKLAEIEKEVAGVNRFNTPVIKQYRDQVIALWKKYSPRRVSSSEDEESMKQQTHAQASQTQTQAKQHSPPNQSQDPPGRTPGAHFSKAITCTLIEKAFSHVNPIASVSEVEALKEVINILAKAIRTIGPFRKDEQVQARAVAFVLPKLPTTLRADFVDRCERRIFELTLRHLKLFLCDEMAALYAKRVPESTASLVDPPEEPEEPVEECAYCKQSGHVIAHCTERQNNICYKCNVTGHIAKHCPARVDQIRSQLASLLDRIASIPAEDINLRKLSSLLDRADTISQPMWRDESLQKFALDRVLPKLSNSMRDRFYTRTQQAGKRVTIRELKSFLFFEMKHPYRAFEHGPAGPLSAMTHGGQLPYKEPEADPNAIEADFCLKCQTKGHVAEQCVDMLTMLGLAEQVASFEMNSKTTQQQTMVSHY